MVVIDTKDTMRPLSELLPGPADSFSEAANHLLRDAIQKGQDLHTVFKNLLDLEFQINCQQQSVPPGRGALLEFLRFTAENNPDPTKEPYASLGGNSSLHLKRNVVGSMVVLLSADEVLEGAGLIAQSPVLHSFAETFAEARLNTTYFGLQNGSIWNEGEYLPAALEKLIPCCRPDEQLRVLHRIRTLLVGMGELPDIEYDQSDYTAVLERAVEESESPLVQLFAERALEDLATNRLAIQHERFAVRSDSLFVENVSPEERHEAGRLMRSTVVSDPDYADCIPRFIAVDAIGLYNRDGSLKGFATLEREKLGLPGPVSIRQLERILEKVESTALMEEVAPGLSAYEWLKVARSLSGVLSRLSPGESAHHTAMKIAEMSESETASDTFKVLLEKGAKLYNARKEYVGWQRGTKNAHEQQQVTRINKLVTELSEKHLPGLNKILEPAQAATIEEKIAESNAALQDGDPHRALAKLDRILSMLSRIDENQELQDLLDRIDEDLISIRGDIEDDRLGADVVIAESGRPTLRRHLSSEFSEFIAKNYSELRTGIQLFLEEKKAELHPSCLPLEPKSIGSLTEDPRACPFGLEDRERLQFLFDHVYSSGMQEDLAAKFGLRWQELDLASQFHLVRFLEQAPIDSFTRVSKLSRDNPEVAREFLRSFFSFSEDRQYTDAIIDLVQNVEPELSYPVVRKYNELVDAREEVGEYLRRFASDETDLETVRRVTQNLVGRANRLVAEFAARATDGNGDPENDHDQLLHELQNVKKSILLFGSTFRAVDEDDGVNLSDIKDTYIKVADSGKLTSEEKARLRYATHVNSRQYPGTIRELVRSEFDRVIEEPGDRYYILEHHGSDGPEIVSFLRFRDNEDGTTYVGSFNADPMIKGMKVGNAFLDQVLDLEGSKRPLVAFSHHSTPNLANYAERFGFQLSEVEVEGEKCFQLYRPIKSLSMPATAIGLPKD